MKTVGIGPEINGYWNRRNGLETDFSVYCNLVYVRDGVTQWTVSDTCMYVFSHLCVCFSLFFGKD